MTTIKVKFRPSSIPGKEGTLYYQVTHLRKVATLTSDCHVHACEWDEEHSAIRIGEDKERRTILLLYRSKIDKEVRRMGDIVRKLERRRGHYTLDELMEAFRNMPFRMGVFAYIRLQVDKKVRMGCYGTAKTYDNALRNFKKFCNGMEPDFGMMNSDFICEYERWMLHTGLKRNSAVCYLRTLRTLYRQAVDDGYTENRDIFRRVHISIGKTRKRAVSIEAIRAILHLDLSAQPLLVLARDLFMFSFYTRGMSFVDVVHLKKSDLQNGFLTYNRRKTFQSLTVQWEQPMTAIVERYAGQTRNSPYFFPVLSGEGTADRKLYEQALQRVNRHLKHIGEMVGLDIPLSTYVARHSWASIARSMDVPLSVISEGLGHDSDKTTQIYLASLDTSRVNQANKKILSNL